MEEMESSTRSGMAGELGEEVLVTRSRGSWSRAHDFNRKERKPLRSLETHRQRGPSGE